MIDKDTLLIYRGREARIFVKDGIKRIGPQAFMLNTNVVSIVLPSSVKQIGFRAFYGCTSLKEVNIDASYLEIIDSEAFCNCSKLKTLKLPKTSLIVSGAFRNSGITSINLEDVDLIGCDSFDKTPFYENLPTEKQLKIRSEMKGDRGGFVHGTMFSFTL